VLTIALVDGVGIPLALGDPEVAGDGAAQEVLSALRALLSRRRPRDAANLAVG
jgi:hypothetical protein